MQTEDCGPPGPPPLPSGPGEGEESQPFLPLLSSLEVNIAEAQRALESRPAVSIRRRLCLGFLLWFVTSLGLAFVSILIVSRIKAKVVFMEATASYTFEIQQARRFEKNYFLYGTNLDYALEHVQNASAILEKERENITGVIEPSEFDTMATHLQRYEELISQLREADRGGGTAADPAPRKEIEEELRRHGATMVTVAEELVAKERKSVNSMFRISQRIPLAFLGILVLLIIYLAGFISKQVLSPLNRIMGYSRRIAQGDFTPLTPQRQYRDEFSQLAMAMNHMVYQLVYRQALLIKAHKLKAIGTLTAGVAHELNNPINNILLTAFSLQEDFRELSEEQRIELVNDLVGESERAQKIVRSLLDFARESEGELQPHRLEDIVEMTLHLASNQIKLSQVLIQVTAEKNLPNVYGDRRQLEQVFLNLVLNALDAMPDGGTLRIELVCTGDRDSVAVKFEDTGAGISRQHLQDIFDPFFTTKKAAKGTGLGLSVSLGIVQRHGGDIHVESELGKGSVFTVLLPAAKIPADIEKPFENLP